MTISYGHGLSATPLLLAAGYGSLANGGYRVKPTLLADQPVQKTDRVMSASVAEASLKMLRKVVT